MFSLSLPLPAHHRGTWRKARTLTKLSLAIGEKRDGRSHVRHRQGQRTTKEWSTALIYDFIENTYWPCCHDLHRSNAEMMNKKKEHILATQRINWCSFACCQPYNSRKGSLIESMLGVWFLPFCRDHHSPTFRISKLVLASFRVWSTAYPGVVPGRWKAGYFASHATRVRSKSPATIPYHQPQSHITPQPTIFVATKNLTMTCPHHK